MSEENNDNDRVEDVNTKSDEKGSESNNVAADKAKEAAKAGGDQLKNAAKKIAKDPGSFAKFIKALPALGIVLLIIIIIIILIGAIGFFLLMPGMVMGKIKQFCQGIWGTFEGVWKGDYITASVTQEDVTKLAQYLQNMGYDIQTYGFGDVTYEENTDETNSSATNKKIKEVNGVDDNGTPGNRRNDYLASYLAANNATYVSSDYSVVGVFSSIGQAVKGIFTKVDPNSTDPKSYATGLLQFDSTRDSSGAFIDPESNIRVNPKKKKLYIYQNGIEILFWKVQWGTTLAVDLSDWTAIYGRPTELFIALHLSTMMPDLAHAIAVNQEFNTKVHISFQQVDINYSVDLTTSSGEVIEFKKNEDGSYNDNLRALIDKFTSTEMIEDIKECQIVQGTSVGTRTVERVLVEGRQGEENYNILYNQLMTQYNREAIFFDIINQLSDDNNSVTYPSGTNGQGPSGVYYRMTLKSGDGTIDINGTAYTYDQLKELAAVIENGLNGGMKTYWPYITKVTNHWFYNDIDFMKGINYGAYRKASTAIKKMQYDIDPDITGGEASKLEETYKVELNATLTSSEGIYYQVCEPEMSGPNDNVKNIFTQKYYKYDGKEETAKKIAIAKALDEHTSAPAEARNTTIYVFEGQTYTSIDGNYQDEYNNAKKAESLADDDTSTDAQYKNSPMCKQNVSFENNKSSALSAFSILENVKTEEAEESYRNLKKLMENLQYFTPEELSQNETQALLWLADNGTTGDTRNWVTENSSQNGKNQKDTNKFGLKISSLKGIDMKIIAPEDCTITGSDNQITLTFSDSGISDDTIKLLEEYRYKDEYKTIDKNLLVGMRLEIKATGSGITLDKTGDFKRGDIIGEITNDSDDNYIEVQMYKSDGTPVDNIESYMESSYTKTDEEQLKIKIERENSGIHGYQYDDQGNAETGNGGELTGVQAQIYAFLHNKGLTDIQIAGIMGNISCESGYDPTIRERKSDGTIGPGIGLLQWTYSRKTQLINYCASKGSDWTNAELQLEFLWMEYDAQAAAAANAQAIDENPGSDPIVSYQWDEHDFTFPDGTPASKTAFNKATTVEDATSIFYYGVERPGSDDTSLPARISAAKDAYGKMQTVGSTNEPGTAYTTLTRAQSNQINANIAGLTSTRQSIIRYAMSAVGVVPYLWGGGHNGDLNNNLEHFATAGLDCSGFVCWCFYQAGVPVNGTNAYCTGDFCSDTNAQFHEITRDQLKPGDMGLYNRVSGIHIELYVGKIDGQDYWIQAPSAGKDVNLSNENSNITYYLRYNAINTIYANPNRN